MNDLYEEYFEVIQSKIDVLSRIISLHEEESDEFLRLQANAVSTWDDAWRELIYCILAGTQVSNKIVQKSYLDLIRTYEIVLNYKDVKNNPQDVIDDTEEILKRNGYRFYRTKTKTIINAAQYFEILTTQYTDINNLDCFTVRVELIKNINGIGDKIASHWLRNIGYSFPIIDIHVRRVLSCAKLIDNQYSKYQINSNEYHEIEENVVKLSEVLLIDTSKLDYILWKHGRDYCIHKRCSICPLNRCDECTK